MITSPDNPKLKQIRKLAGGRERKRSGLFAAEGEDLVAAAAAAAVEPEFVLVAGEDVEPALLDAVSALGSGTRVIGVYPQRWSEPGGDVSVFLDEVGDPGNVGSIIRSAHGLCDGPVVLGPGCADPYSPKAVRASMGAVFARPPARGRFDRLEGTRLVLDPRAAQPLWDVDVSPPVVICIGAEREGTRDEHLGIAEAAAHIPLREPGPDSLNAAQSATVGLYELARRIRGS